MVNQSCDCVWYYQTFNYLKEEKKNKNLIYILMSWGKFVFDF